jgi:hypothetical protein
VVVFPKSKSASKGVPTDALLNVLRLVNLISVICNFLVYARKNIIIWPLHASISSLTVKCIEITSDREHASYISCSEAASEHIDNYIKLYRCDMLLSSSFMSLCSQVLLQHNVSDRNSLYTNSFVPPHTPICFSLPFQV